MPDNVKTVLAVSLRRMLRPLIRIMLREGFTYSHFAAVAKMAFVDSAAKDFVGKGVKSTSSSICALTGMSSRDLQLVMQEQEQFESTGNLETSNPFALVLHGWHNDRDYVGPYGFPADLPFTGSPLSFTALTERHAAGVSPHVVLQELQRIKAVTEVGVNIWKPLVQEYIEPTLSAENIRRMTGLVESLLSTIESNTRGDRDGSELFERTMIVDSRLTRSQLFALQSYLKVVGGQFLQRVDTFAAVDLLEKMIPQPGEPADIRAGLQCFFYLEPDSDDLKLRDIIEFDSSVN